MLDANTISQYHQIMATGVTECPQGINPAEWNIAYSMYLQANMQNTAAATTAPVAAPVQEAQTIYPQNTAAMMPNAVNGVVPFNQNAAPAAQAVMPMALTPTNGSAFTMDDLLSNSIACDKWLKIKYNQTLINDDMIKETDLYVKIDFGQVIPKMSIKGGNPVRYASTIDGQTATAGGSWMRAVQDIQAIDPKARPYNCVDLSMILAQDVHDYNGNVVAPAGTLLGHTTATTNWKEWKALCMELVAKGLSYSNGIHYVKLNRKDVTKGTNKWAILNFSYVDETEAANLGLI